MLAGSVTSADFASRTSFGMDLLTAKDDDCTTALWTERLSRWDFKNIVGTVSARRSILGKTRFETLQPSNAFANRIMRRVNICVTVLSDQTI